MIEEILIKNEPYLLGNHNEKFTEESFFGLKIGDLIKKVGKGKSETSSNRIDQFRKPIRYLGTYIATINKPEKALVFEFHSDMVEGLEPDKCIYKLYFLCGSEIVVPGFDTQKYKNHIRIYKPVFTK